MAYAAWSVVFGEQPSAAKWNILGTNDARFESWITTDVRMKVGNFSITATGAKAITGVGFRPKVVEFHTYTGGNQSSSNLTIGHGAMDSSGNQFVHVGNVTEGGDASGGGASTGCLGSGDPNGGYDNLAAYTSMDSDGFTVNVTAYGGTSLSVGYIAYG